MYESDNPYDISNRLHDMFDQCTLDGMKLALIRERKCLDVLVEDYDEVIRSEVAACGYNLDKLIYDESILVRMTVAEMGYGLNILIHDESDLVSQTAHKMLMKTKEV